MAKDDDIDDDDSSVVEKNWLKMEFAEEGKTYYDPKLRRNLV